MEGRILVETALDPGDLCLLDQLIRKNKGSPNNMFYVWIGESPEVNKKTALFSHFLLSYDPESLLLIKTFRGLPSKEEFEFPPEVEIPPGLDRTRETDNVVSMDYLSLLTRTRPRVLFILKPPRELEHLLKMGFKDTLIQTLQKTQVLALRPQLEETPLFRALAQKLSLFKEEDPSLELVEPRNPLAQLLARLQNRHLEKHLREKMRYPHFQKEASQQLILLKAHPSLTRGGASIFIKNE